LGRVIKLPDRLQTFHSVLLNTSNEICIILSHRPRSWIIRSDNSWENFAGYTTAVAVKPHSAGDLYSFGKHIFFVEVI